MSASDEPLPAMIGLAPRRAVSPAGQRDIAEHASEVAREWDDVAESYVRRRRRELGVPENMIGQPDYGGDGRWRAFDPYEQEGGGNTTGIVIDSGVLESRTTSWARKVAGSTRSLPCGNALMRRSRHEYEELRHRTHARAARRVCDAVAAGLLGW